MTSPTSLITRLLIVVLFLALAEALPAQSKATQFIVTKGKDTVAVEVFTRDAGTLTGEIYQSNGLKTQYTLNLRPDSSVQHVEMMRQGRQGAGVGLSVHFDDTLVTASMSAGGEQQKLDLVTRGKTTPFLAVSFALSEQVVQASHLAVGQSVKWTAFRLAAGDSTTLTATRFHADSVSLVMSDLEIRLAVSSKGEVVGGRHVGQNWLVARKAVGK
jgi:hypothetical protein